MDKPDMEEVEVVASPPSSSRGAPDLEEMEDVTEASEKPDLEEVVPAPRGPPSNRGVIRSRSLDPSSRLARQSPPRNSEGGAPRGRSVSPTPQMKGKRPMSQEGLRGRSREAPKGEVYVERKSQTGYHEYSTTKVSREIAIKITRRFSTTKLTRKIEIEITRRFGQASKHA